MMQPQTGRLPKGHFGPEVSFSRVEAQRRLAEEDVNIVFTSMLGLPKADGTHLTPAGLFEHGKRIFEAYIKMFPEFSEEKLDNTLESK